MTHHPDAIGARDTSLRKALLCVAAIVLAATPALAQQTAAGRIKIASGAAYVVRGGEAIPVQVGQPVYEADGLRTGPDGRIGMTLNDETRVSLGPNSEVRLDRFAYAPSEGRLGFVLQMLQGVASYVSGRIAKLSPDSVRLEAPAAIVGVRGTTLAMRVVPE